MLPNESEALSALRLAFQDSGREKKSLKMKHYGELAVVSLVYAFVEIDGSRLHVRDKKRGPTETDRETMSN